MHFCRYFHDDHLPDSVRTELEENLYETLHGPNAPPLNAHEHSDPHERDHDDSHRHDHSHDRDQIGGHTHHDDHHHDHHDEHDHDTNAPTPAPLTATIERLSQTITFGEYTAGNARMAERIAHEAVHWVGDRWSELEANDPLADEEALLLAVQDTGASNLTEIAARAADSRHELQRAASVAVKKAATEPSKILREAYAGELLDRWEALIHAERDRHRARELGRALGQFVRELGRIVPRLADQQRIVRDALGNEDALWDLGRHEWEELPMSGLEEASRTLGEMPELGELASILGRSKAVTEERRVMTERHEVRLRPVGVGRSEVTGIRAGNDLETLIPSEVALLAHPETEDLFFAKFANGQLFSLEYNREQLVEDTTTTLVPAWERVMVPRGPVVVCVDTSGSMLGFPERIAKATVLALARELAQRQRPLEVIAFSSQIRSFRLPYDQEGHADLALLAAFLSGGFHGGTDLHKALERAVELVDTDDLSHADVLVVSDFRVPKIADRYLARINRAHKRGTLFHALTVAPKPVIDPLHLFDSAWLCNTATGRIDPGTLRRI